MKLHAGTPARLREIALLLRGYASTACAGVPIRAMEDLNAIADAIEDMGLGGESSEPTGQVNS